MLVAIIILTIIVIISFIVGSKEFKKIKKYLDSGIMIKRSPRFYKKEEIYSLHGDWNTVWGTLCKADYHKSIRSAKKKKGLCEVIYEGYSFNALFSKMKSQSETTQIYRFCFTNLRMRKSTVYNSTEMNVLLTTIEKALLQVDPNTLVSERFIDYKTSHDWL